MIAGRVLAAAVLASAVSASAQSIENWSGGSNTWNNSNANTDWSGSPWTNGNIAVFGGTAGTVNIVSPITSGTEQPAPSNVTGTLSAYGLTFNTTGYQLDSSTAGNALTLATGDGSTPIINVSLGDNDTIGAWQLQPPLGGANTNSGGQALDNFVLGGTQGFALNGGGILTLANPIALSGGITVENGSQLQVGVPTTPVASTVIPTNILNYNDVNLVSNTSDGAHAADHVGASLWVNTTLSIFSASNPSQYVGNISISGSGTSTIYLARGATITSSSVKYLNSTINIAAGSSLNVQTAGNTGNTTTAVNQFAAANVGTGFSAGTQTTFNAVEVSLINPGISEAGVSPSSGAYPASTNIFAYGTPVPNTPGWSLQSNVPAFSVINSTSTGTSKIFPSYGYGETIDLGPLNDHGNTVNFLSGGGAPVMQTSLKLASGNTYSTNNNPQFIQNAAANDIQISSATGAFTSATGVWNVGYNGAANPGTTYSPGRAATVFGTATTGSGPGSTQPDGATTPISVTAYDAASLDLLTSSSAGGGTYGAAGITNNTINVSPYSQVHFDGSGFLQWGQSGQTINISGFGNTNSPIAGSLNSPGGNVGALFFTSDTLTSTGLANKLEANVVLQSNVVSGQPVYYGVGGSATGPFDFTTSAGGSVISVGNSTASGAVGPTSAEIDGSITTAAGATNAGPFIKAGPGTLILAGSGNSWPNGSVVYNAIDNNIIGANQAAPNATSWTTGTVITNGSLVVNAGSSLGGLDPTTHMPEPVTLYSTGSTTPTSTNLTLNTSQTIGTLYSVFLLSKGTASNTITVNNNGPTTTTLNIAQTANTIFGPGSAPTLTSSISGTGGISLDASSSASLTLAGPNTYSGNTTINGGALYLTNTTGSATGMGNISVTGSSGIQPILGGNGIATGVAGVTGGLLSPGVGAAASHLPGTLTLGGLTLNQATGSQPSTAINFSLNTFTTSDSVSLGSGMLTLPATASTIPITLTNYGALTTGTYPLITYSGNGGAPVGNFASLYLTDPIVGGFHTSLQNDSGKVDLVVTPVNAPLYWIGTASASWNTGDSNWSGTSGGTANETYADSTQVIFDDNSSVTTMGVVGTLQPALVTFLNNSKSFTLNGTGIIGGNAGGSGLDILIDGTGTVTLANGGGSGNSFAGIVNVDHGGTLIVAADNELGPTSNPLHLASDTTSPLSTFEPTTTTYSSSRTVVLLGAGGSINVPASGDTATLTSPIIGPGDLYKDGPGVLILNFPGTPTPPSSSYRNTFIRAGTLRVGSVNPFPGTTAVSITGGATLDLNNTAAQVGSITGSGNITLGTTNTNGVLTTGNDGTNTTFGGVISGKGQVIKTGTGTMTLTGNNSFTGGLSIQLGTVSAADVYTTSTKYLSTGTITFSFGGALALTGTSHGPAGSPFDFSGSPTITNNTPSTTTSNGVTTTTTTQKITYATPNITLATGGGLLQVPANSAVSLPVLLGSSSSGNLTISGGGVTVTSAALDTSTSVNVNPPNTTTYTFAAASAGNTGGGVTIGTGSVASGGDGGDTLILTTLDTKGTPGTGLGGFIVNSGSTFELQNAQAGLLQPASSSSTLPVPTTLGNFSGGASLGTLQLNDGSTWLATGLSAYTGTPQIGTPNPNSVSTPPGASVNIMVPNSGDALYLSAAWRSSTNGSDTNDVINVTGNGLYEISSGAITTAMYAGSWNINMGATGKFIVGQFNGGGGETLNALGYQSTLSSGVTNPVTISGGEMLFGVDQTDPQNTVALAINSFRSKLTFAASSTPIAIGSTGYEINVAASTPTTTNTAPPLTLYSDNAHLVSAKVSGDIVLKNNASVQVLTNDPINPSTGARSFSFTTNTTTTNGTVAGNFSWGNSSTLTIGTSGVNGGVVNFGRINGNITVAGTATMIVNSGTTVNLGFLPGVTGNAAASVPGETPIGGLVSGIDPLTDTFGDSIGSYNNSVSVIDNGTMVWGGRTALTGDAGTGFKDYQVDSLSIASGATATLNSADQRSDRTVLAITGQSGIGTLSFGGTSTAPQGQLDIEGNDLIIRSGNLSAITADLKAGYNTASGYWNGQGIVSTIAKNDSTYLTTVGVAQATSSTTFDGQSIVAGDVMVKYTYYGDANLNGHVDGTDYSLIDTGFGGGGTGWQYGDFNYDGHIDGSDYSLIDNTFNQQSVAGFAAQVATPTSEIAAGGSSSAVPEPASLGLLAIGALGLMTRRRRRA